MTANSLAGLAYAPIWKHVSLPLSKAPGRPEGVRKMAARFGVDPSTVQRLSALSTAQA